MNLGHLFIFAHVAETGSFTTAARRLGMPISTVSRQVVELEDQLGLRLIVRSTRSLRLTDTGLQIFEFARRTVDINKAVLDFVSDEASCVSGRIKISTPPSLSRMLLAPLVQAFQACYPEVKVQVTVSDRLFDPVSDDVDLAFRVGHSKDTALISRKIFHFRQRLLASRGYVDQHGLPADPSDLANHRLLSLSCTGTEETWSLSRVGGQEQVVVPIIPTLSVNDCDSLVSALLASGGIGNVPSLVIAQAARSGEIVEVLPQWSLPTVDVAIIRSGRRHNNRPAREFVDFAARLAPELLGKAEEGYQEPVGNKWPAKTVVMPAPEPARLPVARVRDMPAFTPSSVQAQANS